MLSLSNIFRKIKKGPSSKSKDVFSPDRDWKVMMGIFILVNALVAVAGLYMFYKVQAGEFFRVSLTKPELGKEIKREELEKTIEFFDGRAERIRSFEESGKAVFDPSL